MNTERVKKIKEFQTAATMLAVAHGLDQSDHTEAMVDLAGIAAGVCLAKAKAAGADWREGLVILAQIFILTATSVIQGISEEDAKRLADETLTRVMTGAGK